MRFTWSVLWIAIATLSPARLEKYMEGKDQFGTPNSGKQGYPNTPGGPTVSPIAHSAMKNQLRSYEFNFSKLTRNKCRFFSFFEVDDKNIII